jgi:hypothetical protein
MLWEVRFHSDAREERRKLSLQEREAMANAVEKLRVHGPVLPYPHSSDVRGADRLRELRPRSGRSPWRALYQRIGDLFVVGAIAPEANVDRRGFARAVSAAEQRLAEIEEDQP